MENRPQWKERLLLLVLAVAVAFPFLGSFGLLEPDEGRFAQIGREMAASGDFLIPRLNGIEQFYKPPLVYWISAVGMRLFGVSEWTARLPSALAFVGRPCEKFIPAVSTENGFDSTGCEASEKPAGN